MKKLISFGICLAGWLAASGQAATNAPLTHPDYELFNREAAGGIQKAARDSLAPAYSYLAAHLVEKYQLANRAGIGVDIGGGPGSLTVELGKCAPRFYWINADINTFQAEAFFPRALTNECAAQMGWIFADVHHLPFRDNYADIVVSRGSFQFWADPKLALSEIFRVLKPGGQAVIGRGFSPNVPIEVAKSVRANQGTGMPKYDVAKTAEQLRNLMQELKITNFEVVRPRSDQTEVNYGVWLHFTKPAR